MTNTTEGLEDEAHGVPLLVHYDWRAAEKLAIPQVDDVLMGLQEDAEARHERLSCDSILRHHHRDHFDLATTIERIQQVRRLARRCGWRTCACMRGRVGVCGQTAHACKACLAGERRPQVPTPPGCAAHLWPLAPSPPGCRTL